MFVYRNHRFERKTSFATDFNETYLLQNLPWFSDDAMLVDINIYCDDDKNKTTNRFHAK
jgi:hypothetical protein